MPLVRCAASCGRIVSVSLSSPNPVAAQAGFATEYSCCPRCLRFWCPSCPPGCTCGVSMEAPSPDHALAIMMGAAVPDLVATVSPQPRGRS